MLKYLEVPDLHFDPQWADITEQVARRIAEAAQEHKVDFIAMPGDLTNRALMASEQGGINRLRKIIKIITKAAPTVAVYGTPSHEPPGSLEHLRDVGLVILEPGKVYGFVKRDIMTLTEPKIYVHADTENSHKFKPDTILFGVPELSKKNIQAQLGLSAEEANAEAVHKYLEKGKQVCVSGSLQQERWETDGQQRSKIVVNAQSVQLLGGKSDGHQAASSAPAVEESFEDDIPF